MTPQTPAERLAAIRADAKMNTDRELWREREGDYYADSIHVTAQGDIGINCGGTVVVLPLREWHRVALTPADPVPPQEHDLAFGQHLAALMAPLPTDEPTPEDIVPPRAEGQTVVTCASCGHAKALHGGPEGVCVAECKSLNPLVQCGCPVFMSPETADGLRRAIAEYEAAQQVPTTPIGPVTYTAWPRAGDRPSLVVARWKDAAGRRVTQFVASCQSAGRDTDMDAAFIADAFNRAESGEWK
jgi:hypothetical protein